MDWKGLRMVDTIGKENSNYQYCVFEVTPKSAALTRDQLLYLLRYENVLARRYFYPGVHRMKPYDILFPEFRESLSATDYLSNHLLQLPVGASVSPDEANQISDLITFILKHQEEISQQKLKTWILAYDPRHHAALFFSLSRLFRINCAS